MKIEFEDKHINEILYNLESVKKALMQLENEECRDYTPEILTVIDIIKKLNG